MAEAVLTINAGSSSLKFSLYRVGDEGEPAAALEGQIEGIGTEPHMKAKDAGGRNLVDRRWQDQGMDHSAFFRVLGQWLREQLGDTKLAGVGHRVVHGGTEFTAPVRIDDEVLAKLDRLCPLAPLHQPHNLAGIRAVAAAQPDLPQVACFDTAFHRTHSELADWFALPRRFYDDGIRRYGFHGLSYEYIAKSLLATAPELGDARVVVAHLGSGASMCAMRAGRSVDSTMGFTALDGLPMGTRSGALDPGVVLHLIRAYRMDADAIEAMLYHDCGLKGVSGISNDMRNLLASDDPHAAQAIELFVWHIAKQLGALSAVLGGLDAFVFTAGIGERSPEIRRRVCTRLGWLGIALDEAANRAGGPRISTAGSKVAVFAIPTDEELMIARHTLAVLNGA
jgi:acetate kinase